MTAPALRVFVNERGVAVPAGATVLDAVRAADPALAARVLDGSLRCTDGRAIEIGLAEPLHGGAIVRVVGRARPRDDETC